MLRWCTLVAARGKGPIAGLMNWRSTDGIPTKHGAVFERERERHLKCIVQINKVVPGGPVQIMV